jgi:DNA modification methylase
VVTYGVIMVKLNWKNKSKFNSIKGVELEKVSLEPIEIIISPINNKIEKEGKHIGYDSHKISQDLECNNEWLNMLIMGDNLSVMHSLLDNFTEKINLIYIDPPFATGSYFNSKIHIGEGNSKRKSFTINRMAYDDNWREGINSYLNFMYERLLVMRKLLTSNGSIYVHLDWHLVHYVKIIMDEIFGSENFRNEIIWAYPAASVKTRNFFIRSYDTILFYTKSDDYVFNDNPQIYMEYSNRVKNALKKDDRGTYYYRGGSHNGKKLSRKVYVKHDGIFPRDVWNDIPYIRANTIEYQGFSTQKPELLLKRIILASTSEGDLVADFFCGSGTTLAVAEKLKRRWIGCDFEKYAIYLTKKRLLNIYNSRALSAKNSKYKSKIKPFKIFNQDKEGCGQHLPPEFLKNSEKGDKILKNRNPEFELKINVKQNKVRVELIHYIVPYREILSKKITENINNWKDWIDSWSIDYDFQGDIFNTMWVSYRTPKNRALIVKAPPFRYDNAGNYTISIKTSDILGIEVSQHHEITIN